MESASVRPLATTPAITATADLHHEARRIATLARDALELATPGPRIDLVRARAKLAEVARIAAEVAQAGQNG